MSILAEVDTGKTHPEIPPLRPATGCSGNRIEDCRRSAREVGAFSPRKNRAGKLNPTKLDPPGGLSRARTTIAPRPASSVFFGSFNRAYHLAAEPGVQFTQVDPGSESSSGGMADENARGLACFSSSVMLGSTE